MPQVPQYHVHDFELKSETQHVNPFKVALNATFVHESGYRIVNLPGFYDGDGIYKIRFSPSIEGEWNGLTNSEDPVLNKLELDTVDCVAGQNVNVRGVLQIDPLNEQRFAWENGEPFVTLGFECDWLFSYHQRAPDLCRQHLSLIRDRGFSTVVTNLYAHTGFSTPEAGQNRQKRDERPIDPTVVYGPPSLYCWGGNNDAPDHSVMNVDFFRDYDAMMAVLHELGMVAHIMIQVQNKHVKWPTPLSSDDDLFWRYVVARYQAYGNVVWDVGKESYNLHRQMGGHSYALNRIDFVRAHDAYGHLVTVHDSAGSSPGRNSELDCACDFVSDQVHLGDVYAYNREAIRRGRISPTPYLNIEYGYELGVDQLKTYTGGTTKRWEDVLMWTYALYMGGAYANYYYDNTSWDLIKFEPEPPGWARYRALKALLDSIPFNSMRPDNELVARGMCLADEGNVYVLYLPEGGDAEVDLSVIEGREMPAGRMDYNGIKVDTEWMDVLSLEKKSGTIQPNGFRTSVANPLTDKTQPCVVVLRASGNQAG